MPICSIRSIRGFFLAMVPKQSRPENFRGLRAGDSTQRCKISFVGRIGNPPHIFVQRLRIAQGKKMGHPGPKLRDGSDPVTGAVAPVWLRLHR